MILKYEETLPVQPSMEGAIQQFRADAHAAGITKYLFQHIAASKTAKTVVAAEAQGWRIAKLIKRRTALYETLGIEHDGMKVSS